MNTGNIFFRVLSFMIGVAVFGFYIYVVNHFTNSHVLEFPYLILTLYFALCIVLFPFTAYSHNEVAEKLKFFPSYYNVCNGSYSLILGLNMNEKFLK